LIYCGIDPGYRTGGVALLSGKWCELHDLPVFTENGVDCAGLIDILRSVEIEMCIIERQQAFPKQGGSSIFKLGMGYGQILACLAAAKVPHKIVSPRKWKNACNVPTDKDGARRMAIQLYPNAVHDLKLKKHEHRAEALLMASYGEALG